MLIDAILKYVTYTPDARIYHVEAGDGRHLLRVDLTRPDSVRAGMLVRLPHVFVIPDGVLRDNQGFCTWLADRLIECETHESREWFKVDGTRFVDPHVDEPGSLYR